MERKPKCVCVCVYECTYVYMHDEYLYNVYIQIFPTYNTESDVTVIFQARALSREDSRREDEIEKKSC